MTITSAEAAAILSLTTGGVRKLVERGDLTPMRPGARPLRFTREAVIELEYARRSPARKAAHAEAARCLRSMRQSVTMRAEVQVRPGHGSGALRAFGE